MKYDIDEVTELFNKNEFCIDSKLIENFVASLNKLIEYLNGDLSTLLMKSEEGFKVPGEISGEFKDFMDTIFEISKTVSDMNFLNFIAGENDKEFWAFVKKVIQNRKQPYCDSEFLRANDFESYSKTLKAVFNSRIIHNGSSAFEITDKKNANVVIKILNYSIEEIIGNRMSNEVFKRALNERFGLIGEKSELIWELINANWQELFHYLILNKIYEYGRDIDFIKENLLDLKEQIFEPEDIEERQ